MHHPVFMMLPCDNMVYSESQPAGSAEVFFDLL
jgi:hypothetical protein